MNGHKPITPELAKAYLVTLYRVFTDDGEIILSARGSSPALRKLLARHGANHCAYLTAYNPHSQPTADAINRQNQEALIRVTAARWTCYSGEGSDPERRWPGEPSLLILGIDLEEARSLATRYGQNAFLYGEDGDTRLIATDPAEQEIFNVVSPDS